MSKELKKGEGHASITSDTVGRLIASYVGDYNIIVGLHIILGGRLVNIRNTESTCRY